MKSNATSNNNHAIMNASNNNNSTPTATGAEIIPSSGRGRGKSWTAEEDIQLCQSWIVVSEDPITGRDQRLPQMWDRIHENFAREIGGTTRSSGSLMNRYSAINKEVTFFNVIYYIVLLFGFMALRVVVIDKNKSVCV
ncbi:hypothetical protein G6F56_007941 [Rhizopus delemar]|nr:hypothetical protein G6F56_007941 [Rhizopus delemar]